jgi:hypothetical protein
MANYLFVGKSYEENLMRVRGLTRTGALLVPLVCGLSVLSLAPSAGAAGSGYAEPSGTVTGPTGESFPVSAVLTPTNGAVSGTATVGTSTVDVSSPAGALDPSDQLVVANSVSQPTAPGATGVVSLFVGVYNNGTKVTGTFAKPVTIVISDPNIKAGDVVQEFVNGAWTTISNATVVDGKVVVSVSSDPTIEVVHPKVLVSVTEPLITLHSRGAAVRTAQIALNGFGAKLVVDGVFGAKTQAATKAFQKSHGLVVDGIIGKKTWAALGK